MQTSAPSSLPEQRVGAFTLVPGLVRGLGGDPDAVLADAGVPASLLDHPDNRISFRSLGRLLAGAARHTACPHFGLLCGKVWGLRDLGLVGEIVRNGETVGDALRTLVFYQRLNSSGGLAFLVNDEITADFGYAIYQHDVEGADQLITAVLAAGCNYLQELCGGQRPAETVLFPYARPAHADELKRFFRCTLRFDADRAALRLRGSWLRYPVPGADSELRSALEQRALEHGPGGFVECVVRTLRTLLLVGRHSGDDVAQALRLHRRTLNRRLKAEGTSFQAILDDVRFEVARQLLATGEMSMDEIAMTLGYSGLSAFQRTFRRWAGETPGRWRHLARSADTRRDAA